MPAQMRILLAVLALCSALAWLYPSPPRVPDRPIIALPKPPKPFAQLEGIALACVDTLLVVQDQVKPRRKVVRP